MPCLSIDCSGGSVRVPARWRPGCSVQVDLQHLLGPDTSSRRSSGICSARSRPTRRSVPSGPTVGPGNAYRKAYGQSEEWPAKGYHLRGRGHLRAAERGLHQADHRVQEAGLRDSPGRDDRSRLDHLHETVLRSKASSPRSWKGSFPPCSRPPWRLSDRSPTGSAACSGSIPPSRSSRRSPALPARRCATTSRRPRACSGSKAIMHYAVFEWAVDVFKRTTNIDDKEEFIQRVQETKMADSLAGPIDFTVPVQWGTSHPTLNCVTTPTYGGQWRLSEDGPYQFELVSRKQHHYSGGRGSGHVEAGTLGGIAGDVSGPRRPSRRGPVTAPGPRNTTTPEGLSGHAGLLIAVARPASRLWSCAPSASTSPQANPAGTSSTSAPALRRLSRRTRER